MLPIAAVAVAPALVRVLFIVAPIVHAVVVVVVVATAACIIRIILHLSVSLFLLMHVNASHSCTLNKRSIPLAAVRGPGTFR